MCFFLSPRHREKQEEFRRFALEELRPAAASFPRENIDRLAGRGYLGLPLPREWGGQGEDFLTYILLIEEVSRVCASTGVILAVHTSVGTFPLFYYGSPEQKERYLSPLAAGEMLGAFALTESSAGSDAAALRTTAVLEGDTYILRGAKIFITSGGEADLYTVFATVNAAGGKKGITAFLVEKDTPGLEIGPPEKKMGLHGSPTTELIFNEARVPRRNRLGGEGQGFHIARSLLDGGRIGIGAQGLGLAGAALDGARNFLQRVWNESGGSPPAEAIWAEMAGLYTCLEAARLLVYRAALRKEQGLPCAGEASMAKMFATDLAMRASTRCLDFCHQAGGSTRESLERCFCDAKVTQIYEGTNQVQRLVITRELLKKYM